MRRFKIPRRALLLHLSLAVVAIGGLLTWLTQEKGSVKIAPGQTVDYFLTEKGDTCRLPVSVTLERFEVVYYPGGTVPRDYVSHLIVDGTPRTVSMNNIFEPDGYRFLQASYDSTGATVLSVNHDPWGIGVAYAGFLMFAAGGLWVMVDSRGRYRTLLKGLGVMALLAGGGGGMMAAGTLAGMPREVADSLRSRPVLYNGRTVCFNTLARDVVTKLYGKPTYRGLSPEQTLMSLRLFPEEWKTQPLLKVKDRRVAEALGIEGKYASLADLFDSNGGYRVEPLYLTLGHDHRRGVEELDEKVGIVLTLFSGELIVSPPDDAEPMGAGRVLTELTYNAVPYTTIVFILLFCGSVYAMFRCVRPALGVWPALTLLWIALALSVAALGVEWYLTRRLPLANTYETLRFVVIVMMVVTLLTGRRNGLLLAMGLLMSGSLALVAHLVKSNPVVTQLMPVLHSGWLSLHVVLVMTSYALLTFTFVTAIAGLVRPAAATRMRHLSQALLYPGDYLLGLGIITGAVWANVSWGQYWSWDPKETWALITFIVYAVPLHSGVRWLRPARRYHLYLLAAILFIAMTYFGVNYMNSLHAYN